MKRPTWLRDILAWNKMPLSDRLEELRKYHCTGPCGQWSCVMTTREELNKALGEAITLAYDDEQNWRPKPAAFERQKEGE